MIRFSCNNCRVQGFFDPRRRWLGDPFLGGPFAGGRGFADPFMAADPFATPLDFDDGFDPLGGANFGYSGFSRYTALYNRRFY